MPHFISLLTMVSVLYSAAILFAPFANNQNALPAIIIITLLYSAAIITQKAHKNTQHKNLSHALLQLSQTEKKHEQIFLPPYITAIFISFTAYGALDLIINVITASETSFNQAQNIIMLHYYITCISALCLSPLIGARTHHFIAFASTAAAIALTAYTTLNAQNWTISISQFLLAIPLIAFSRAAYITWQKPQKRIYIALSFISLTALIISVTAWQNAQITAPFLWLSTILFGINLGYIIPATRRRHNINTGFRK